jgi:hypothetical protein
VTITATPNPLATPPSVSVALSVTPTYVMSSVAVYRNDHNGRTLLRSQPAAGFDSRTVIDYECPYEENVTYDWTVAYSDPSTFPDLFNETWASTASWSTIVGTWNVSGGKLRNTTAAALLTRSFSAAKYRITVASWAATTGVGNKLYFTAASTSGPYLQLSTAGVISLVVSGSSTVTAINPTQPFVIDMNASSITVSGTGGGASVSGNYTSNGLAVFVQAGATVNTFLLGAVKVETYPTATNLAETSSAINLAPSQAWLIHPGSTSLSVPMSETDTAAAGIVDISPVENPSNATVHKILGSATPVPTTVGPRTDDRTTMTVATVTSAEAVSLRALLAPDVPLLVQVPPSWDLDFNSGFYQVGDITVSRTGEVRSPRRIVILPLQKVQSPVVDIENTGWSYASVAAEFASYADILTTFATYADLASNSRI